MPDRQVNGERPARPSDRSDSRVDRIEAICPGCQATLKVRRNYIGIDVICKRCKQVFQVRAPTETQAVPEPDHRDPRQHALEAEHERLNVAHNQLQADHDQLKTDNSGLRENLRGVTIELESIRAALGMIAPEQVGSLANERQSLAEEVDRLRDEVHALLTAQAERDQLVAERQRWVTDLDLANSGRDLLAQQIQERDDQLHAARAERDLVAQQLRERDDQLQAASAERDLVAQQLQERDDRLHAARAELDDMRALRQTALTELDQLRIALARIDEEPQREPDHLDTERVASDEQSRTALLAWSKEAEEVGDLRAQVKELGQRLEESEQIHREMAEALAGMGIRCQPRRA